MAKPEEVVNPPCNHVPLRLDGKPAQVNVILSDDGKVKAVTLLCVKCGMSYWEK